MKKLPRVITAHGLRILDFYHKYLFHRKKVKSIKVKTAKRSSSKGGIGEREVFRLLTLWVTGKKTPEVIWRSASSGGKATRSKLLKHTMAGDGVAIAEEGLFLTKRAIIEVKNRKGSNVLDFFSEFEPCIFTRGGKQKGKKALQDKLHCWWMDLCSKAWKDGKQPLLIFKRYQSRHWYLIMNTDAFTKLLVLTKPMYNYPVMTVRGLSTSSPYPATITRVDHFIDGISIDSFKKAFPVKK